MSSESTTWSVRRLGEEDWADFIAVDSHAFATTMPDELIEGERELHRDARDIGAYDGPTLAGIATAYAYDLSVPGSSLPAAAVSWVGVLPTYRRRGVLRALMTHQLQAVREQGDEPLAILWASEPQIYGRFGYGLATRRLTMSVPRYPLPLKPALPEDPALRLRLAPAAEWKLTAPVYEAVAARRPGVPARDEFWWQRAVRDVPALREGRSELRCVVVEDDSGVRGYARYSTKASWDQAFPAGEVSVREVMAVDAPALAALYRYLFDLDLMSTTELWNVPVDDPLLYWMQDPRRAKPAWGDALYVRVVDLPRALTGRTYASETDLVLEVADDLLPENAGRWRLRTSAGGPTCERTDAEPDISLGVVDLGAVFLGGTTFGELAEAARVRELRPGSLTAASAAFLSSPAPWNPAVF